jgi:hypothetical protein
MAKRRARDDAARDSLDEEELDEYVPTRELGRRRTRRRGRPWGKLLFALAVLVAVVAALPTIVANSPLLNSLLAKAVPDGSLRVTASGASLGWFSAPSLTGVEISDAAGEKLATVEAIRLNRSPLALLGDRTNLGEIEVEKPVVYVAVLPDGTNWQKALAPLLKSTAGENAAQPGSQSASPPVAAAIRVIDGTVLVEEASTAQRWRLYGLNAQVDTRGVTAGLPPLSVAGQLDTPNAAMPVPATFSLAVANDGGRQQLNFTLQNLPLAAAEPWLRIEVPASTLRGTVFGQGTANWMATAANPLTDGSTNGTLTLQSVEFAAPELAGDTVRLSRVEVPWRLTSQATGLTIDDLQLTCDIGRFAARGTLDPALTNLAARHNVEFQGEVDLAPLAAMLPHLLRIRGDTKITAGKLELAGRSQPIEGGQSLTGMLRTANVAATSGGRPLAWEQPINATFEVRRELGNLRLESLKCQSDFLSIAAAGTTQQLTANANFDLNRLAAQLGQFVDLSGAQLAGTGTAHLDWLEKDGSQFAISANSEVSQLRVGLGDGKVYAEPRLAVKATALGIFDPLTHQPTKIASGEAQVAAEGDLLDAKLTEPVDFAAADRTWPVAISLTGDIARWMARLRPWFAPDPWQASGTGDVTAQVRASANAVQMSQAKVTLSNLQVAGAGWNITEPKVELAGDLEWNTAAGELAARSLQLVSSTVSLAAQNLQLQALSTPPKASGVAAFRADVARVAAWQVPTAQPTQYKPSGMVTGNVRFDQQGDQITGEFTATGEQLALQQIAPASPASRGVPAPGTPVPQTIWQEPQVNLRGTTTYEATADRIAFRQVQIQSATLALIADGQVDRLSTTADLNANGALNYDLAKITPLLKPFVGDGIQLVGSETARFQAAGSLKNPAARWARTLAARGELPWTSANIYGLPIGPGKLAATLGDGTLRVDPLSIAVAEGQLTASPVVRLDPEPMELTLPAGPLLSNVRISPQVSEAMLKFIAPVLAGATQSEGQFSMTLSGARVPLTDSKQADVAGQLAVHSVRVVPGPMAKQWVELAQQVESLAKKQDLKSLGQRQPVTLLTVQDQQVNFRVVDGRVYHQGMQFQVGDVVMRTEGSVGLDETVAIVVHVPIQDKWIEGKAFLVGLRGQSLSIPISGTLRNPKMDQSAVAGLSQQLLQGAAQQAIGGELNKALDKFLKPR